MSVVIGTTGMEVRSYGGSGAESLELIVNMAGIHIQATSMDDQAKLHTDYLIDAARIQAMQGESGLQGASQDRVSAEADNNYATDAATLEINRQRQMTSARTQGVAQQSRANVQLAGIKYPSNVGTALQIAGNVASLYKPGPGDAPITKPQGWDSSFDNPKDYG